MTILFRCVAFLSCAFSGIFALAAEPVKTAAAPRMLIAIGPETTRITEPLRPDGYPDYLAVLDQLARKGVMSENNGAVLFWRAMGPKAIPKPLRGKYFNRLGIEPPPEQGDYFINAEDFFKSLQQAEKILGKSAKPHELDDLVYKFDDLMRRPWSKEEFPVIAQWLAENEKPLAVLTDASQRPRCYHPLESAEEWVLDARQPAEYMYSKVTTAFYLRAMLRLEQGKVDDAWNDALTCHRYARQIGEGQRFIDIVRAYTSERAAATADRTILQSGHPSATQIAAMKRDLDALAPLPKMADQVDLCERYQLLDSVAKFEREGYTWNLDKLNLGRLRPFFPKTLFEAFSHILIDWNQMLRMGNAWFDRIETALRMTNRADRRTAINAIEADLRKLQIRAKGPAGIVPLRYLRIVLTQQIGEKVLAILLPSPDWRARLEDEATMWLELDRLAFALEAFHAEHQNYPTKLAELTPKHVATITIDLCDDQVLHYRREGSGYLLYSVGRNRIDDGGRNETDIAKDQESRGEDDIVFRMPAPSRKP